MRDVLLKRVRPLVDRLAADLVELAVARIEAELERLPEVFEVALSAYAGGDMLTVALGPELAAMMQPVPRHRDLKPENMPPSPRARPDRTALQANGKKPPTCTKCGFVGGNARGCGTAHVTRPLTSPVLRDNFGNAIPARPAYMSPEREITRGPVVTSSPTVAPRRAKADPVAKPMTAVDSSPRAPTPYEIAAAKTRSQERVARIAHRADPTSPGFPRLNAKRDDNENAEERWKGSRIAEERELAESHKHTGELPAPRSSFVVTAREGRGDIGYGADLGDVEELNFDGGAG